jgi:hypothetical protein
LDRIEEFFDVHIAAGSVWHGMKPTFPLLRDTFPLLREKSSEHVAENMSILAQLPLLVEAVNDLRRHL